MKLVVEYQVSDGCTYSFTETVPVEYESAESFIVEFEQLCKVEKEGRLQSGFLFAGKWFDATNFFEYNWTTKERVFYPPKVFTVDEWFDYHGG